MKKAAQFLAVVLATVCVSTTVLSQTVSAASWKQNQSGWWYQEDNGTYSKEKWKISDRTGTGLTQTDIWPSAGKR